jgi:hypothetical protein
VLAIYPGTVRLAFDAILRRLGGINHMAIRRANPEANGNALDAQATTPAKPENRYLRGMRVIADSRNVDPDGIAKQADMSKSGARACIIAWNTAVHLLDQKKALAVPATDLVNDSLAKAVKAPEIGGLDELGLGIIPDGNGGWRIEKRA